MSPTSRLLVDETDLRSMQDLAVRLWRHRGEGASFTPGDLAWWFHGPRSLKGEPVRLWEGEGGSLVAWAWFSAPADVELMVDPEAEAAIPALVEEAMAWAAEVGAGAADASVPPPTPAVWAVDGDPIAAELRARGMAPGDKGFANTVRSLAEPFDRFPVPEGYQVRPYRGEEEIVQRVEVHRAAFAASRMTVDVYRGLMGSESYRDLAIDMVAQAPDGSLAASCICWCDGRIGVAELEPVGTHPDHQRLGLGRAVCAAALEEAARRGASLGLVAHDVGAVAATRLYEGSLGFREVTRHRRYEVA